MSRFAYLGILLFSAALAVLVQWNYKLAMGTELASYRHECTDDADRVAKRVELTFAQIYRELRTIARLPGVRAIEHDGNGMNSGGSVLDGNTRLTIQEIYNSLVSEVAVSELYVVPINLDPDGLDPTGASPTEPFITFDSFIVGQQATSEGHEDHHHYEELEEIEIHEYRLMRSQLDWMLSNYPTESDIDLLAYPMLSGSPVVTCDNSRYDQANPDDEDRSGLVLSIPFYWDDGSLGGCISGVILNHALSDLLHSGNETIFNSKHDFIAPPLTVGQWLLSQRNGVGTNPDESLLFSSVVSIPTDDAESQWALWTGRPDASFWSRSGVSATIGARNLGFGAVAILGIACFGATFMLRRAYADLADVNEGLEATVNERTVALRGALNDAKSADRAKSAFLANMSHEIRTPMTAILGYTDLLLDQNHDASSFKETVQTVKRNGGHLLGIINDILDLSKLDAERMSVEHIEVDPAAITNDVVSLLQDRANQKGLNLNFEIDGSIPVRIQSDPLRLRQILTNVVGNAIKFTSEGSVRIVLRLADLNDGSGKQQMVFDVIDTGIGMSDEQAQRIFQPFSQADTSTTRRFGGTGLGLAISTRLAQLLGGDITIASESDRGSTFSISVRTGSLYGVELIKQWSPPDQPEKSDDSVGVNLAGVLDGVRILLAEDGPDNQRLFTFHLTRAGADVVVVDNGQLAVGQAADDESEGRGFDLILMDMQMPVMDGYEATRTLRQNGYQGPIVALTAHAMSSDRQACIDAGCSEFITKPINRELFLETLRQQLQARSEAA